jgi:hypothetical protein
MKTKQFWQDTMIAAAVAALLSGIPSTLYAWWMKGDVMEATRAAGAMLIAPGSSDTALVVAAAIVHCVISLFWAALLVWLLPRKHISTGAVVSIRKCAPRLCVFDATASSVRR